MHTGLGVPIDGTRGAGARGTDLGVECHVVARARRPASAGARVGTLDFPTAGDAGVWGFRRQPFVLRRVFPGLWRDAGWLAGGAPRPGEYAGP